MIKRRIKPNIQEGKRCKFGKVSEKYQNYKFFENFLGHFT